MVKGIFTMAAFKAFLVVPYGSCSTQTWREQLKGFCMRGCEGDAVFPAHSQRQDSYQ